ncbi:GNAT family N-acetyltransferase [Pontivivens insulae]|uniref:N-acetyltransferase domain-containing protein n=1 Tax=Pontivivens insulae TaxID=1639689 RepID=A0A2R8ADE7_9RHOB|nr:GNAT family N-acetyltransferase [Pontivivens insulae]RED14016.1 acetyltransferase (GNAT) family protein [Pontivivens insulae]SPF30090.1 hypothetical protein POI8812_02420 [Pontivivens insulae]
MTEATYTITYLAMDGRPDYPRPAARLNDPIALLRAEDPPVWYFLSLYGAVGGPYEWTDRFRQDPEELEAFVKSPDVHLYTLMRNGWPAGFFQLDFRTEGECDLAYFGLVPEAVGSGLGRWLLQTAIHMAWDGPGVKRLEVNTCTLDHPAALPLYQKCGFTPYEQEVATRVLSSSS